MGTVRVGVRRGCVGVGGLGVSVGVLGVSVGECERWWMWAWVGVTGNPTKLPVRSIGVWWSFEGVSI